MNLYTLKTLSQAIEGIAFATNITREQYDALTTVVVCAFVDAGADYQIFQDGTLAIEYGSNYFTVSMQNAYFYMKKETYERIYGTMKPSICYQPPVPYDQQPSPYVPQPQYANQEPKQEWSELYTNAVNFLKEQERNGWKDVYTQRQSSEDASRQNISPKVVQMPNIPQPQEAPAADAQEPLYTGNTEYPVQENVQKEDAKYAPLPETYNPPIQPAQSTENSPVQGPAPSQEPLMSGDDILKQMAESEDTIIGEPEEDVLNECSIKASDMTFAAASGIVYNGNDILFKINVFAAPINKTDMIIKYETSTSQKGIKVAKDNFPLTISTEFGDISIKRGKKEHFAIYIDAPKPLRVESRFHNGGNGGHVVVRDEGIEVHAFPISHAREIANKDESVKAIYLVQEVGKPDVILKETETFTFNGMQMMPVAKWEYTDNGAILHVGVMPV